MWKIIATLTVITLIGCGKATVTNRVALGKIVDAQVVPTSFNERQKMLIKTEKAVIIIYTLTTIDLGREAWSVDWSNGKRTFTWDGARYTYNY